MKSKFLSYIRSGKELTLKEQFLLIIQLSIPAIFAQLSSIVMQYIDAAMVGRLGENGSAAIGLVSTSTWLLGGISIAVSTGFTVQVAHHIGAGREEDARRIVRQGLFVSLCISLFLLLIASFLSPFLPTWLGGEAAIRKDASLYFLMYALSIPVYQINHIAGGMLQCSGNMKLPSILHIIMCGLDVVCNYFLIFPTREVSLGNRTFTVPGAGLGVMGAALGTTLAECMIAACMLYFLLARSESLHLRKSEHLSFRAYDLKKALKIALPVGIEQVIMCGAYIACTVIVAPLKKVAIAANAFAVTAESLCYMPGYGIGSAATTIVGQSIGAKRPKLARRFGFLSTLLGMAFMAVCGLVMYFAAPLVMGFLTPVPEIRDLGVKVLRIEVFAEPLYGASIVATGVFRGAGDTLVPCILNFCSMWLVRIPIAAVLAPKMGLSGVWLAMCMELCVRGILYLIRLSAKKDSL